MPNSEKHRNFYLYLFVKPNLNSKVYTLIIASIIASLHIVPELVKENGEDGEGLNSRFPQPNPYRSVDLTSNTTQHPWKWSIYDRCNGHRRPAAGFWCVHWACSKGSNRHYSWTMAGPLLGCQFLTFIQVRSQDVKLFLKVPADSPHSNLSLHSRLNLLRMFFPNSLAQMLEFEPRSDWQQRLCFTASQNQRTTF